MTIASQSPVSSSDASNRVDALSGEAAGGIRIGLTDRRVLYNGSRRHTPLDYDGCSRYSGEK